MLRSTDGEYPEFIAAVSILFGLPPDEARAELELRAQKLAAELADTEVALASGPLGLPRLFLLEEEYRKAVLEAELGWIRGVVDDLRDGRLTWSEEWLREIAAAMLPPAEPPDGTTSRRGRLPSQNAGARPATDGGPVPAADTTVVVSA